MVESIIRFRLYCRRIGGHLLLSGVAVFLLWLGLGSTFPGQPVNPRQTWVNTRTGGYWRTHPNSTTKDNLEYSRQHSDGILTILGILLLIRCCSDILTESARHYRSPLEELIPDQCEAPHLYPARPVATLDLQDPGPAPPAPTNSSNARKSWRCCGCRLRIDIGNLYYYDSTS
jgi:hypothetical protein